MSPKRMCHKPPRWHAHIDLITSHKTSSLKDSTAFQAIHHGAKSLANELGLVWGGLYISSIAQTSDFIFQALSFPPYLYKFYQMSVWITQNIIPSFWVSSMFLLCIKLNGNCIMSFKSLGQYIFVHIKINEIYNDLTRDDCIHTFQETHCSRLHSHSHLSSMSYLMCGMKTGALQPGTYGLNTQVSPVALCAYMCQPQLLSYSEGRWALGKIAQ